MPQHDCASPTRMRSSKGPCYSRATALVHRVDTNNLLATGLQMPRWTPRVNRSLTMYLHPAPHRSRCTALQWNLWWMMCSRDTTALSWHVCSLVVVVHWAMRGRGDASAVVLCVPWPCCLRDGHVTPAHQPYNITHNPTTQMVRQVQAKHTHCPMSPLRILV